VFDQAGFVEALERRAQSSVAPARREGATKSGLRHGHVNQETLAAPSGSTAVSISALAILRVRLRFLHRRDELDVTHTERSRKVVEGSPRSDYAGRAISRRLCDALNREVVARSSIRVPRSSNPSDRSRP
jgi:hypothetical protein